MPRFGMAYSVTGKDVIRAGFGGFMSRPGVYDSVFLGGNPPWQPMVSVSNGVADNPGGGTRAQFPQFFMTIDPKYKIPRSYNWNASYQRQLTGDTTVEVGYIGTVGNYLSRERDLNQPLTGAQFASPGVNAAALRPYKGFANINMLEHSGRSTYHAMQFEVSRRFSKGFLYGFAYTLSKAMDNNSGPRDRFYDVYNQSLNWGKSGNDTRHVAILNLVWEVPFLRNSSNRVLRSTLGGWQVSAVNQWQTGAPLTIGNGDDYLGIASTDTKPWNLNGSPDMPKKFANETAAGNFTGVTDYWFAPTKGGSPWATKPANGTYPNQNRNSVGFNNVGFQNWNLSLFKSFRIAERHTIQLRGEGFNWINHPNWSGVETNPTSAQFGMVTGKSSERNVTLSLRYSF
jgi:hypothetical protein